MDPKPDLLPGAEAQRNAYDEFSAAFAEIEAAIADDPPRADVAPVTPAAAPAAATPAVEPPAAPVDPAAPAAVPAAPPAEPVTAAAPPQTPADTGRLAALEVENAALKEAQRILTEPQDPQQPQAPVQAQQYQFNEQERQLLEVYDKEWTDVSRAEAIRRNAAIYNAVAYVFNQMRTHIEPKLKQFSEISELMQNQLALGELRREAPDYDNIYDAVGKWVDTLPTPFKAGARLVMESGTTEEVSALIKEYRKANPAAPGAAPIAAAAPVAASSGKQQDAANLSPAAKQAAQRLSVVGSKRSAQRGSAVDPNDFDGAWEEALRESNS